MWAGDMTMLDTRAICYYCTIHENLQKRISVFTNHMNTKYGDVAVRPGSSSLRPCTITASSSDLPFVRHLHFSALSRATMIIAVFGRRPRRKSRKIRDRQRGSRVVEEGNGILDHLHIGSTACMHDHACCSGKSRATSST